MDSLVVLDKIRPLLISEKKTVAEVRHHSRKLAEELTEEISKEIAGNDRVLFVFILRGAMLLYPPFAEKFESASFAFVTDDSYTALDCKEFDAVIFVDTVVETGKTILSAKKLLSSSGITAKLSFCACACANNSAKDILAENFDKTFCLTYLENVRITIDAGKYAGCGDGAQIG